MCRSDCSVSVSEYEDQQAQTDPALSVPYTLSFRDKRTLPSKGSSQQLRAHIPPPDHLATTKPRFE